MSKEMNVALGDLIFDGFDVEVNGNGGYIWIHISKEGKGLKILLTPDQLLKMKAGVFTTMCNNAAIEIERRLA